MTAQLNRVLILDDDGTFRALMVEIFRRRGIKAIEARSVREANLVLEEGDPFLAIVDYRLPEGDGITWISKVREQGRNFSIVFLSGTWCDGKTFNWLRNILRVSLILKKPIDPELFLQQIEGLLPAAQHDADLEDDAPVGLIGAEKFIGTEVEQAISTNDPQLIEELKRARSKLDRQNKLAQIKTQYKTELSASWQKLCEWVESARSEPDNRILQNEAVHTAHKIYGTAGSLGFKTTSAAAGKVETLLQRIDPSDSLSSVIWSEIDRALESGGEELQQGDEPDPGGGSGITHSTAVHKILILGKEIDYRELTKTRPDSSIEFATANSAAAVLQKASTARFDAVIIDASVESLGAIVEMTRQLREGADGQSMPFACISNGELIYPLDALYSGFSVMLDALQSREQLNELVQSLVEKRFSHKPKVLSVDDDQILTSFISTVLSAHEINLRALNEPIHILEAMAEFKPDMVLLDVMMPGLSGYDVCRMLRSDDNYRDLPIVFLTSKNDTEGRAAAFQAGGTDFLSKPVLADELVTRVLAQLGRAQRSGRRYQQDVLTGVMGGEAFIIKSEEMLERARGQAQSYTLCIITIDELTQLGIFNGWNSIQTVLKELGALLRCRFRVEDARGRFGEDGFGMAFLGANADTANAALALLREEFNSVEFTGSDGQTFSAGFTSGVAQYPQDGDSLQSLLVAANRRMLEKRTNRSASI